MDGHSVLIENRNTIKVTGVKDVEEFTEEMLLCTITEKGLCIRGKGLRIESLDKEGEVLQAKGEVESFEYVKAPAEKNILKRLLK